jgi:hypothetical protein
VTITLRFQAVSEYISASATSSEKSVTEPVRAFGLSPEDAGLQPFALKQRQM